MRWFTYMKAQNVAFFLSFDKTGRNINGIKTIEMAFGDDLCLGEGTLLSGVILSVGGTVCFVALISTITRLPSGAKQF